MDKIELHYDLTGDDLTHFMQKTVLRFFRIIGIITLVLAALIGLGIFANPDLPLKMLQSPIIMAIIFLVGIPLLMRFNNRRIVNKNPQHYQGIHFIASDEGIEINTSHTETRMKWGQFQKVKKTDKMYLLYQNKRMANIVPMRAFENEADRSIFEGVLKANLGDKVQF